MIIVKYRKPLFQDYYPWKEEFETMEEALDFTKRLGSEYDFKFFKEIKFSNKLI